MQYILFLLCLFELLCVPAVFLKLSLSALTAVYLVAVIVATGVIIWKRKPFLVVKKEELIKLFSPLMILVFFLMIYQLFVVLAYQHNDADDAWYIGSAVTACQTDTLFQYSSYTGLDWDMAIARDYVLSPFPIFLAMWSGVLRIHPLILAHNVYPVLMLIWAYFIYWKIGKRLFEKQRDREYFLLFINVLYLFGYFSTRTTGTFLLFRSWQGKSVFCAIMVPLLFYYFLELLYLPKDFVNDKKWFWKRPCMGMILTNFAATLTSFSAVMLMPLLTGALALTYAVSKRAVKVPAFMCLTCIPNVILLALYIFVF